MDVVLAKPCSSSFKLQTNNNNNNMASICRSSSLTTATLITRNPPTSYHFRKSCLRSTGPGTLVAGQVLIKEDGKLMKSFNKEDEVDEVIVRLKMAAERLREMEIQKFMSKVKGGGGGEEQVSSSRIAAEEMSREIFSKFFEKPIEYLTSDAGCLLQKLKDVRLLVGILEKSCPCQR